MQRISFAFLIEKNGIICMELILLFVSSNGFCITVHSRNFMCKIKNAIHSFISRITSMREAFTSLNVNTRNEYNMEF